ncbi:zinc finger and BTB domain-containing protein 26-like isoform X2 [Rhineura floridana]|uniref:zinc finger and BTB domain-containing protein 26-like isoform X2 n=1 Tax=Rhineura floridana TaxID=261503 RepID=UPI002AC8335A|nr:zinc finger and BTB domain-containing protein 26-like isoform X2 [Rhineura floridana]
MAPACERLQFRFPGYGDGVLHRMDQLREQRRFCDVTVQSPEIGRQLLLSCYTGCLEVPIKELVSYLTAASFLQMGHVVERCAQAVSHYLVPKADALLREEQGEGSYLEQDGEEREEKQPSSPTAEADCEENKAEGPEFTPRSSRGPSSPAISLSLINSAVEITRSYLQGCYDDDTSSEGLPFPSAAPAPASQWRNHPLHRHRHSTAVAYRDWRTGSGMAAWKVPGLERPYRCPRCSSVFQQLGNFVSHVQEHKLFLCLRCGKVFSQKSNLTRHIRVHTGFKPFQCPICRKCFTQNATLQDHLNLHSGIKPHKCNYCEMHFTHKPGLRRHLKEMHGKSTVQNSHEEIEEVTIDFD